MGFGDHDDSYVRNYTGSIPALFDSEVNLEKVLEKGSILHGLDNSARGLERGLVLPTIAQSIQTTSFGNAHQCDIEGSQTAKQ